MHFLIDCGLAIPVGEEIKDGTCADFKISDGKIIDIKKADITPNGDKINSSSV